jgi:hypothetical protein
MAKLTYQPEGLVGKFSVDWMRADIWSQLLVTAEQESQWETFLDTLARLKIAWHVISGVGVEGSR